jgi:sugar lactone lactonase YvrE
MIYGCDGLDPGPFPPFALFGSIGVFVGSEDMGFDGRGHAVVRDADTVYLLDYDLGSIVDFPLADPSYGLRFHPNGNILAAMYSDNEIRQITPAGDASAFATGVGSVNGLHPDHDGNVWYTNFSAVVRLDANGENPVTIASGSEANGANGVYFDADRSLLFYTQYGAGIIRKVAIDSSGNPGTNESIATIDGNLDGMAMDVQGNLYVVDNEGNDIYRVCLDEAGDRVGDSQLLTNAPTEDNIANVVFGDPNPELAANETWAPDALYAIGVDGTIYQIEVGVAGKPIPQVPDA